MKKPRWHVGCALIGTVALLVDVYAFGGLREQPVVGQAVSAQARLQSPLMHTYLVAGGHALRWTPFMRSASVGLADAVWSDAYPSVRQHPELALYMLRTESRGVAHAVVWPLYWGAPAFLLLALIGQIFRPRKISLIGGGR